jgi:hypothetical protein
LPVIAEGEVVGKRRTRSRAGWLLLAPITLVAILLLPVIGPVDFEIGGLCFLISYESSNGRGRPIVETFQFDWPGIKDYDYNVGAHVYRLDGTAHLHTIRLWNAAISFDWCPGKHVADQAKR